MWDRTRAENASATDTAISVDGEKYPDSMNIGFDALPPDLAGEKLGVRDCPGEACNVTVACAGNVDGDDFLDVWSISTVERRAPDGSAISPGEPFNHRNDINDE